MKAQYISENIRFERRLNPKKALGLGIDGEILKVSYYGNSNYISVYSGSIEESPSDIHKFNK